MYKRTKLIFFFNFEDTHKKLYSVNVKILIKNKVISS